MAPKRKPRTCKHCGATHWNRNRKYCSDKCRDEVGPWNKGKNGFTVDSRKTGKYKECKKCGNRIYIRKGSKYGFYCSMKCYLSDRWDGHTETRVCTVCNNKFDIRTGDKRVTCSSECAKKWKRLSKLGEKSVLWRGGKTSPYNKEWRAVRAEALERDGRKCVLCGSTDRVQVHHIIPYRYSKSHDINNLTTLCRSCHSKEELKINKSSRDGLLSRWKSTDK